MNGKLSRYRQSGIYAISPRNLTLKLLLARSALGLVPIDHDASAPSKQSSIGVLLLASHPHMPSAAS